MNRCYCVFVFRKPLWDHFWISSLTTLNPQIWISTGTNKNTNYSIHSNAIMDQTQSWGLLRVLPLNLPQTLICGHCCFFIWQGLQFKKTGFPGGSVVKNLPANAGDTGDMGSIPGSGRSPGEGNGNLLQYFLAWKIPWTETSGRLQPVGSQRIEHDWATQRVHTEGKKLTHCSPV